MGLKTCTSWETRRHRHIVRYCSPSSRSSVPSWDGENATLPQHHTSSPSFPSFIALCAYLLPLLSLLYCTLCLPPPPPFPPLLHSVPTSSPSFPSFIALCAYLLPLLSLLYCTLCLPPPPPFPPLLHSVPTSSPSFPSFIALCAYLLPLLFFLYSFTSVLVTLTPPNQPLPFPLPGHASQMKTIFTLWKRRVKYLQADLALTVQVNKKAPLSTHTRHNPLHSHV